MRHQELIEKMTLEEKAAFLTGKNEWASRGYAHLGIDSITFADGPSGVRRQCGEGDHLGLNPSLPATCFPSSATMADSWNEKLEEEVGEALGQEAALADVSVLLAPGLNLKRNPLCGRNFEYFSEDPYLSGKMAAAMIRGIQKVGVSACAKHFALCPHIQQHTAGISIQNMLSLLERNCLNHGFRSVSNVFRYHTTADPKMQETGKAKPLSRFPAFAYAILSDNAAVTASKLPRGLFYCMPLS